jgi:hypothetical protein
MIAKVRLRAISAELDIENGHLKSRPRRLGSIFGAAAAPEVWASPRGA